MDSHRPAEAGPAAATRTAGQAGGAAAAAFFAARFLAALDWPSLGVTLGLRDACAGAAGAFPPGPECSQVQALPRMHALFFQNEHTGLPLGVEEGRRVLAT